jgi:hypothetical protein
MKSTMLRVDECGRWLFGVAWAVAMATATALPGCKKGDPPEIVDPGDQVAIVGQQLTLHLLASDADGDDIEWSFETSAPDIDGTAAIAETPDGQGVFTFTPVASQVGTQAFDFIASDGRNKGRLTVLIEVRGAVGSGSLPIFRKPLGSGTVLDLEQNDCVSIEIQIEDPDSTTVTLGAEPPVIEDSDLSPDSSGLTGTWSWCPSREQQENDDKYDLTLSANDGENPAQLKDYIIVLRKRRGEDCPGEFPVIDHEPMDFTTLLDLQIDAHVSDDQGLKDEPYLLWSPTDPGDPIDFNIMTLQTMSLVDGDMMSGDWRGFIPNPTANEGIGATAEIFYLLSAADDDDTEGDCDHLADHPESGVHRIGVENDGSGGSGLCEQCSFDVQCGEEGDLCLLGTGGSFCGQACTGAGSCPNGYTCSADEVESIDGVSARQCIPNSGACGGGGGGNCEDDDDEDNDTPDQGIDNGAVAAGTISGRTLCAGDEDWYAIELSSSSTVTVSLAGDLPPDMDVALAKEDGSLVKKSDGLTSDEELTSGCQPPGTYLVRVYTVDASGSGNYSVTWSASTTGCGGGGTPGMGDCCIDNNSPGCEDETVQSCVCAIDDFCCETEWDNTCAGIAANQCDSCGGGGGDEDCCTPHTSSGCDTAAIETCVCAQDAFCCSGQWDATCVEEVGNFLCAPACTPDDADGPCCMAHAGSGCEINSVEMCVCMADEFCCSTEWDAMCVSKIEMEDCGNCP